MYMLKTINTKSAAGRAPEVRLKQERESLWRRLQTCTESKQMFDMCDYSRVHRLLKCRLAWYGLRSVEVGSFRLLTQNTFLVDLFQAGGTALRVEVDRRSGAIKPSAAQPLSRLLTWLPQQSANDSLSGALVSFP
jgi:hypothetical protein